MKNYYIHFIRHGETLETKKGAYIGTTDVLLSEDGKLSLQLLDEKYKYPWVQAIFTSPLKRCTQTCKILYPNIEPIIIDQLSECCFGDWENKTAEQLNGDEVFERWLAGSTDVKPPNGESSADFTRRICLIFEDIINGMIKSGTTDCAIITHGGVIMQLLAVYGLPQAKPFEWAMQNGCGYSIRINPMLWQRDKVTEVYQQLPVIPEELLEKDGQRDEWDYDEFDNKYEDEIESDDFE